MAELRAAAAIRSRVSAWSRIPNPSTSPPGPVAYLILQTTLLHAEGEQSRLRAAIGSDLKGKISPLLYCLGIGLAFVDRWISLAIYVAVALIWLVPDRRVERHLTAHHTEATH